MDTGLKGRVALVTASSQGIGKATACAFAQEGAHLAMCARNGETLEKVAHDIRERYGVRVHTSAFDVADPKAVKSFVAGVMQAYGRLDVCVTNAGGPPVKPFLATSLDEWRRAFEVNLLSAVSFCREVIPHMQKNRWGRIVTITSVSVKQPIPDLILSNSIRTGVVALVKSLAQQFGRDGILVNNVGPGYTRTERLMDLTAKRAEASGVSEEDIFRNWEAETDTGRIAEPEDIANAVVWLASEQARSITGQTILVDNGSYKGY